MEASEILFFLIAGFTVVSAGLVAFSRKLIHSAFALLSTLLGVAGLYAFLSADFLAVAQIMVYVGGVLVLILFGVMLTQKIYDTDKSELNNSFVISLAGSLTMAVIIWFALSVLPVVEKPFGMAGPTTSVIGKGILSEYLLPFEIISVLLLGALIAAVYMARAGEVEK
jgi:NADH-quinone oxidoreductase subunit J